MVESETQQGFVVIVKKNELNCAKRCVSSQEPYSRSINQVPESSLQNLYIHRTYLMHCLGNKCHIKGGKE
jgi:hypothetical protein